MPLRRVFKTWYPLAASWILMALELPLVSATMARLEHPEISLAAYGGIVFPLALIIEAPIIMLLAASTALCKDRQSYRLVYRFMLWAGGGLTLLHIIVATTPLYGLVVGGLINAPLEIRHSGQIGMIIMIPWTWAIAFRRLQQGVLIRFGRSHQVGIGTVVRLITSVSVLAFGYRIGTFPGIVVGTSAVATGVICEAVYSWWAVRPVIRGPMQDVPPQERPLTVNKFLHFYIPLAITSLFSLLVLPVGSAAISRMPRALECLAVWPVLNGLTFTFRCLGLAFTEVVVALLDEPGAARALRRFTLLLSCGTSLILFLVAATPLAGFYFAGISALSSPLAMLAGRGLWIAVLIPGLGVHLNWHQGILVHRHRTRVITQAVSIYITVSTLILISGILLQTIPGLFVALSGTVIGFAAQVIFLWFRNRAEIPELLAGQIETVTDDNGNGETRGRPLPSPASSNEL